MDTMVTPKVNTEPEDPSVPGRESTTETESEKQLRMFVTMPTVRVLYKYETLKSRSQEKWAAHVKRVVNQTMEGLTVSEGFCPDVKRRREEIWQQAATGGRHCNRGSSRGHRKIYCSAVCGFCCGELS